MKVEGRWHTAEDYNAIRASSLLTKVRFFWRKGWTEIPAVMGSVFIATIGFSMVGFALYYGETHDLTPKYRHGYIKILGLFLFAALRCTSQLVQ